MFVFCIPCFYDLKFRGDSSTLLSNVPLQFDIEEVKEDRMSFDMSGTNRLLMMLI
jgi:hypothetical protein